MCGDCITVATEQRKGGGVEEVKIWPKESVAASECGLAPVANDLIAAADESIQSEMWQRIDDGGKTDWMPHYDAPSIQTNRGELEKYLNVNSQVCRETRKQITNQRVR